MTTVYEPFSDQGYIKNILPFDFERYYMKIKYLELKITIQNIKMEKNNNRTQLEQTNEYNTRLKTPHKRQGNRIKRGLSLNMCKLKIAW